MSSSSKPIKFISVNYFIAKQRVLPYKFLEGNSSESLCGVEISLVDKIKSGATGAVHSQTLGCC